MSNTTEILWTFDLSNVKPSDIKEIEKEVLVINGAVERIKALTEKIKEPLWALKDKAEARSVVDLKAVESLDEDIGLLEAISDTGDDVMLRLEEHFIFVGTEQNGVEI